MADSTVDKQRRAARALAYKALTEKPADESRAVAVAQIEAFATALTSAKDRLGSALGRWKFFDDALAEARNFVTEGDALKGSEKEVERIQRRRFYARAYVNLVAAADQLEPEIRSGATWVVLLDEAADTTKKAAEKAADKAADLVDRIGDGLTGLEIVVGLSLLGGAIAFGLSRGRR